MSEGKTSQKCHKCGEFLKHRHSRKQAHYCKNCQNQMTSTRMKKYWKKRRDLFRSTSIEIKN